MDKDVREAAARRRNMLATSGLFDPLQAVADATLLADAFLATHRDDDGEQASMFWVQSIGWTKEIPGCFRPSDNNPTKPMIEISYGYGTSGMLRINGTSAIENPTRGQVRSLCAALGIPLEANDGQ